MTNQKIDEEKLIKIKIKSHSCHRKSFSLFMMLYFLLFMLPLLCLYVINNIHIYFVVFYHVSSSL